MSEDADITADVAVIRQELLRRAASDQLVREQLDPRFPTSQQCQRVHEVDTDNLDFLAAVIERCGWPGNALVGAEAGHSAWLIAQHMNADFQEMVLPLLAAAVACGDAAERDHAYLADRVAMHGHQAQRWGTQSLCIAGRCRLWAERQVFA